MPPARERVHRRWGMLQRRLRKQRVQLSVVRVGPPAVHVERELLQSELRRRDVRVAQPDVQDPRQRLRLQRRLLLEAVLKRSVPGILVLQSTRRRVLCGHGLLHRHLQQDHGADARHVRGLIAGRTSELRSCGRTALRGYWPWGQRGVRGGHSGLRWALLQSRVCALGAHRRARMPAGKRLPRRRRSLHGGWRLLRFGGPARRFEEAGHVRHHAAEPGGRLSQPDGVQARWRRLQAEDHVLQFVVRLLQRQLRNDGHMPSG